jgi:predicted PurR-regulated permease PerM
MTLVFLGVFGGFITFGFLGMFIGPTLLAVAFALLKAWQRPLKRKAAAISTRGGARS